MSNLTIRSVLISAIICFSCTSVKAQIYQEKPELQGDIVIFPITLINVCPFISGTVNGISGKFMFDTGFGTSVMINDELVGLPDKKGNRSGITGSGQVLRISKNDHISEISFVNGLTYRNLKDISSGNYGFLQQYVTPDFLGYIGYQFFRNYLFKIDYLQRKITFYRNSPERGRSKDFLKGEKVLAVISFRTGKLENHPLVDIKINGTGVLGAFDSGQNGFLQLDPSSAIKLQKSGHVRYTGMDSNGDTLLTIKDIVLDGKFKMTLKGSELTSLEGTKVIRKELAIDGPNLMTLGYRFLSQYKTVLDYQQKKIYILEY